MAIYQKMRILFLPLAVLAFTLGFILSFKWVFFLIGIITLIAYFVIYSGRKQRIRYWFQGYVRHLRSNGLDEELALQSLKDDFKKSKHGKDFIGDDLNSVSILISHIIQLEFKFSKHLANLGVEGLENEVERLQKEVKSIEKEILGVN